MFLYGGPGETDGPSPVTNKEFYKKVANQYTELLSTYTGEGQCYRVDLRLRPDGTLGEICISVDGATAYYGQRARDWEKQMLIKARVSAGDPRAGRGAARFRGAADLPDLARFPRGGSGLGNPPAHQRENGGQARAACRARYQTDARRHPRYRIPDAVPAAPAWRARAVGAPRRHHDFAAAAARQRAALRRRIRAARRGVPVSAQPGASPANGRRPADAHAAFRTPRASNLLARKMPPDATGERFTAETHARRVSTNTSARCAKSTSASSTRTSPSTTRVRAAASRHRPSWKKRRMRSRRRATSRAFSISARRCLAQTVAGSDALSRPRALRAFSGEGFCQSRAARHGSTRDPISPRNAIDIFEHSPYFADDLLRYPELLDEIGEPFQLEGGPLGDDPRCAASTAARCCASRAEAFCDPAPIFATLKQDFGAGR